MGETKHVERAYGQAREAYAQQGVDTERALETLAGIPVALPCWQGDDVGGFESPDAGLSGGGIQATGSYPGKARTPDELRADLDLALDMIPGTHRLNLHASYGEFGGRQIDRNEIRPEHYRGWIAWAKDKGMGMDFNPTCFSHPKAADGFTLSHADKGIRDFWIEHCVATREIAAVIGRELGTPCVNNVWIPDGYKDLPADRKAPRERLVAALDDVFRKKLPKERMLDCVESKLFGIGSEAYVVGSHEFYMGYAMRNRTLLCLDAGHFHPTEMISDKISSMLLFVDELLLHVSRGVRWDSDHVVILSDGLRAIAEEIVRGGFLDRVHIGLDFFDASINRVAAWVIGARTMTKALLLALLEPTDTLKALEAEGDYTGRLALLEQVKTMPFGAVWDMYCLKQGAPQEGHWIGKVRDYEKDVLSKR